MTIYETIKAAVPVRQAAEHYGLRVNRNGMACCPFHNDRNPSLKLNEEYFYCFGCGAKGDVIDFVARLFDLSNYEAAQRLAADFGIMEEALGIRELMTRCDLTQEQAARKLGKSRSALANSLRLLNLPETVLELLKSGFLTTGHAKVVLGLPTPELQEQAAQIIADHELNVRQAEALCKKLAKPPKEPVEPAPRGTLPVEVEESLKQALGSEVNVAYHDGKGKLTVHFYSDEQLKAFANLLGQYQVED